MAATGKSVKPQVKKIETPEEVKKKWLEVLNVTRLATFKCFRYYWKKIQHIL